MDAYRNPYTPGAGSRPAALAGRDAEIEQFRVILGRLSRGATEQGLVLHGLRGVGKTVLLNKLEEVAIEAGWATAFSEVQRGDEFRAVVARAIHNVIRQLEARRTAVRALARLKSALRSFSATLTSDGEVKLGVEVSPTGSVGGSGHFETDLVEMFLELGRAATEVDTGVAVLLDELQLADREDLEALVAAIHRSNQKALPITVVAAGLPTLPQALAEAKTYAERLFSSPSLGALSAPAARDALILPARALGVEYTGNALELILDKAKGYPYFIQEWGRGVWNVAVTSQIDIEDVAEAVPLVQRKLAQNFFSARLSRTTPTERRYCAAMASLGEGPYESAAVATALGYANVRAASTLRASLIEKGMIFSAGRGTLEFTVPRFAAFLRESEDGNAPLPAN